nr:MAG TPA: hypothetical protein [Caudoviricetes sp.]
MSKAVMLSIQLRWCELIAAGEKTMEVRKTRPKLETPYKCYIYCTKGEPRLTYGKMSGGKVIGEFICDKIERVDIPYPAYQKKLDERYKKESCCTYYMLHRYCYHDDAFFWHISDLKIYDKPKEISEFKKHSRECYFDNLGMAMPKCSECTKCNLMRPPQSWNYVEEIRDEQ